MSHSETTALVFITGRDCERYVVECLESLARQTFENYRIVFVDDASTDSTLTVAAEALNRLFSGRHELVRNLETYGKARNAHEVLRRASAADFVAILDADDQLVDDRILEDMADAYDNGYDVVWSNYVTDQGGLGGNGALDPFASPRSQGWKTSHFFSFRKLLFDAVDASYLQDDEGNWLTAACDFAIAFPILDQTRRYLHIPRPAYRYTATNPNSHHNMDANSQGLNSTLQQHSARIVVAKPPLRCTRFPADEPAVLHGAIASALARVREGSERVQLQVLRLAETINRIPYTQLAMQRLVDDEKIRSSWLGGVGGWALDAGLLHHIAEVLDQYPNPRVLEFGSGRGSKVLARLCANRGGSLISVEHNPEWHQNTSRELEQNGLAEHATVRLCPLIGVDFFGIPGRFYDLSWLTAEDRFDVVIVDGPPAATCSMARLPALPAVAQNLSTAGFHLYLDDYERPEEQKIVEIWRKVAPELSYVTLEFGKGVCEINGRG